MSGENRAKDASGNARRGETAQPEYSIDTANPTVVSVDDGDRAATLTVVPDADLGVGKTFTVTVVFSEAMDTSATPTLTFTPAVASTLSGRVDTWSPDGKDRKSVV